jgi:hypothetical protein
LPIPLVFALASYRYNLYYCRLMLGSMLGWENGRLDGTHPSDRVAT